MRKKIMTIKYIWSVTRLSGWFIFTFMWGTVPSMLKSLSDKDDSTGIPIKASTQRHCTGLALTSSYIKLFILLLNKASATYLKNSFKLPCVFLLFFPLCFYFSACRFSTAPWIKEYWTASLNASKAPFPSKAQAQRSLMLEDFHPSVLSGV